MGTFLTDAAIAQLRDAPSAFESPIPTQVVQRKHRFDALGPADGLVKSAILGLNRARLYKLEASRIASPFPADKLDAIKTAYEAAGGTRTNLAYGYVA